MTRNAKRLARQLAPKRVVLPVRYGVVQSVNSAAGTLVLRPSNAVATDGSEDVTARCLAPVMPAVGAVVRFDVYQGDVLVLGSPTLDGYPGLPFAQASGSFTMSISASTQGTVTGIALPSGRFTVAPNIFLQSLQTAAAYSVAVTGRSSTAFDVLARHVDATSTTTTFTILWAAVQMTSTSAGG